MKSDEHKATICLKPDLICLNFSLFISIFYDQIKPVSGRPKDEDPHIKQYTKNKREITEYIVSVNLDELGIETNMYEELKALFELFDLDRDGVLNLAEFEKVLRALGRSCMVGEIILL